MNRHHSMGLEQLEAQALYQSTTGKTMEVKGRLATVQAIKDFSLAGNARITIVGITTRFTYKITRCKDKNDLWFVSLMNGPDNESDYQYLGTIKTELSTQFYWYKHGVKSKISQNASSSRAWEWFFLQIWVYGRLEEPLQVWHEGYCGRCGRLLTVPESIERGIGPECAEKMAMARGDL